MAGVLASMATSYIVNASKLRQQEQLSEQLQEALTSRVVIEQAKGVLMAMRGIDEHSAFDWLRQTSQNRNVKLRSLAENVVAGVIRASAEGSSTG